MSTRSRIGILNRDGSIDAHYCHSDGYFSWNGRHLHDYYQDRATIQQLIDLGDMSVLKETIGEKHDFNWRHAKDMQEARAPGTYSGVDWDKVRADPRDKMCLFYKRDRNEEGDLSAKHYASIEEFAASGDAEEFLYLYDDVRGAWLGTATSYQAPAETYEWHLLSDLAANDWKDGRDEQGENPTVRTVPLRDDKLVEALAPTAANDDALIDDDPAARAIF